MNLERDRPWYRQRWAIIVAGFAAAYIAGILFATAVHSRGNWDHGLPWEREWLTALHSPLPLPLDFLMLVFPWFGTNISLMPGIFAIVAWLWVKKRRVDLAMWLLIVQLGSWLLNPMLKGSYDRLRPDLFPRRGWFGWTSYPSGHAIATVSVLFTLAIMLHKERGWKWPYLVFTIIGFGSAYSRLYLSVHWPTDVIGGLIVGAVWLWACYMAFNAKYRTGLPQRAE